MQDIPDYRVDSLIADLQAIGQVDIRRHFPHRIRVRGKVTDVRVFQETVAYVDLESAGECITVKCAFDQCPEVGEYLLCEGNIILQPSRFGKAGLEILISGGPIGTWEPKIFARDKMPIEKNRRILLSQYVERNKGDFSSLLILGSATALRDVESAYYSHNTHYTLLMEQIPVANNIKLVREVGHAIRKHRADAFAIVRGGKDASLEIWNDPDLIASLMAHEMPFYLALGHSEQVTLADKYADEVFHTPTTFGTAMRDRSMRAWQMRKDRDLIEELQLRFLNQVSKTTKVKIWFLGSIAGLLFILVVLISLAKVFNLVSVEFLF